MASKVCRRWSKEEVTYLETYRENNTIEQIASVLGRTTESVQQKSVRLGLNYVNENASLPQNVNENFFKVWTPNMAYILGYWFADGNMSRNKRSVSFASKDIEHLHKIQHILESTHKILSNHDGTYRLSISRQQTWWDIYELGGRPAKSLTAVWPDVPVELAVDFVRGYVDGDGCLYFRRTTRQHSPTITIAGTRQFLQSLSDIVCDLTGITSQHVRLLHKSKAYEVRYGGTKAKCFAYWVYSNSELHLDRKYAIYQEFLKWYPKQIKRKFFTEKMISLFPSQIAI